MGGVSMKASEPLEWTLNPRRHGIGDFEVQLNELGIVYVGGSDDPGAQARNLYELIRRAEALDDPRQSLLHWQHVRNLCSSSDWMVVDVDGLERRYAQLKLDNIIF